MGTEVPGSLTDRQLFNAATKITIGDGATAQFWHLAWLQGGMSPKDVQLQEDTPDQIQRKFTPRRRVFDQVGILSTIPGSMGTDLDTLIWKRWAPPKCKFFAWLAFQNQLWTADRMEKRGWPNQRVCPLCREANESALHLLAHCRYSNRIWRAIRQWTAGHFPVVEGWDQFTSISHWWQVIYWKDSRCTYPRVRSLILVVAWEIWNERNARIFQRKFKPPELLIEKIKAEAITWCLAGAKHLKEIVSEPVA
ncbi:hypothetical protein C2845_PM02G15410 [Panicum miliaceum]|uniref:Reverse transcriptase zinc-binding domain-containing protein n=1 Tax=Panicum miliaceum TaxID=4540 RepID=A0A3L6SC64_PANMI|nr:hypothetical protein C2845_PM02G15410 [Panicum miliaceum]